MDDRTTRAHFTAAERRLTLAQRQLETVLRQCLRETYDTDQLDLAIEEYRLAASAYKAVEAQLQRNARRLANDAEPEFDEELRHHPTKGMRFAKWLVETGRLSDG